MTLGSTYNYNDRHIFDLETLISGLRFILVNAILACIFSFLTLEQLEWTIFSFRNNLNDNVIDNTSWNLNKIL